MEGYNSGGKSEWVGFYAGFMSVGVSRRCKKNEDLAYIMDDD